MQQHGELVEGQDGFHHEGVGVALGVGVRLDVELLQVLVLLQPSPRANFAKRHAGQPLHQSLGVGRC